MPFSQNWTFCRAFSPLDVAHASKAGAPRCARARYSPCLAERDAGCGLWPAVFAMRRLDYLARAKPGARTPSPSGCRVLRAPLWILGSPAPDGPPDARHWSNVGIGAMTWAAAGRLAPQRVSRCGTSTPLRRRPLADSCALPACEPRTTGVVKRSRSMTATTSSSCEVALPPYFPIVPPKKERPYPSQPDKQGLALRARTHPVPFRAAASVRDLARLADWCEVRSGRTLRKNGGTSNTPPRTPKTGNR